MESPLSSRVPRSQFTTGIRKREPIDRVGPVIRGDGHSLIRLYYFTELRDMNGETVTHRWEYEGKVASSVRFKVGADHWRVYSNKGLSPSMTGHWKVAVIDSRGNPIADDQFAYEGPE